MKLFGMTLLLFSLDILIFGSIIGLIYVVGYGLTNLIDGTTYNLTHMYFVGLVLYIIVDSFISKIKKHYSDAVEFFNRKELL